jgi:oxygen-independent coproporphyrinogen-3 oxidase
VQSFHNTDLEWMHRAHNARQAYHCIENALTAGFQNLTIDLIYGAPVTTDVQWQENVRIAFDYGIPHLSCYSLTVEEGTALAHFIKKGKSRPVDELCAAGQMEWLMEAAEKAGYEHYEISNYAKPGWHAKHNSNYWLGAKYLGIGPSAHSYNGSSRQWNITNNALYIKSLEQNLIPFESEILTDKQRYNEYVLTALRTAWGCTKDRLASFGPSFESHFYRQAEPYISGGKILETGGIFTLSRAGKLMADRITVDLFIE